MRANHRPVGLFVDAGGHAWVMTGFEATADPASTASFKVTSVQAMGPLYPDGTIGGKPYDPGPGTWLSLDQLRSKVHAHALGQGDRVERPLDRGRARARRRTTCAKVSTS